MTKKGRPREGRVKLTCYILPSTRKKIELQVFKKPKTTKGKIVDSKFRR